MNLLNFFGVLMLCATGHSQQCEPSANPPDPKSGCCGATETTTSTRLTGRFANLGEYPWMGIVEYRKQNQTKLACSAILISGRYALTAAQCFSKEAERIGTPVNVRLGEYDTSNDGLDCVIEVGSKYCDDGVVSIPIEKTIVHPDFNKNGSIQSDIALIRLAEMAPYTEFIRPICLPATDITVDPPRPLYMKIAGWGAIDSTVSASNILHHVDVPYVDLNTCQSAYVRKNGPTLGNGQLCAGSEGKDACKGDSGGPLMLYNDVYTAEVVGIISFGPVPCGLAAIPGVYTKVFAYDAWIRENIKE